MDKKMKSIFTMLFASRRKRFLTFLMSVVVFTTTYALILPAISLTSDRQTLSCTYSVHQHTDDCYVEEPVYDAEGRQTGTQKVLVCGRADYVAHQHDDSCYQDGKLVCQLPEIKAHVHEKDCYKTEKVLSCGLEETDGHTHTDSCYKETKTLTCTKPEHTHTDACYSDVVVSTEEQLICGYEEGEEISPAIWSEPEYSEAVIDPETGEVLEEAQLIRDAEIIQDAVVHHHDDSCYETIEHTERQLTCGMEEYTHDDFCYDVECELTCGLAEGEAHRHSASCYTEQQVLTCTEYQELHTHTMECYEKGPEGESPEEMGWAKYEEDENGNKIVVGDYTHRICGKTELLEHQHGRECFSVNVLKDQTAAFDREVPVEGADYHLMVSAGAGCGIPEDAVFKAAAISEDAEDFDTYAEQALDAVAQKQQTGSASECKMIGLFDLSIYDAEGNEIQPGAPISVTVVRPEMDADATGDLYAVHFPGTSLSEDGDVVSSDNAADSAEAEVIDAAKDGGNVSFEAESFSVYAIVEAGEPVVSLPDGWYVANSVDQIEALGKDGFCVSYSNYYLTGELVHNVTNNSDRDGLAATSAQYDSVPEEQAAKFYFVRQEGTDTFKIYTLGEGDTKKYVKLTGVSGNTSRAGLTFAADESEGTAFTIEKNGNNNNFYISAKVNNTEYWWNRNKNNPGEGAFVAYNSKRDGNTARVALSYYIEAEDDPYKLDGKTFGIAYNNNSSTAAAVSAAGKTVSNQSRLEGVDMLIRADVLSNSGILLVSENSDIQEWTFEAIELDKYKIKTTVEGTEKYLCIDKGNVTLVDGPDDASVIQATPGTGANKGKWHFTAGNYSLNFAGSAANGFNAANNNNATTWLNLVEKSTLSEDDFTYYSARKISASDDLLGANAEEKAKVIVYTRVWNSDTNRYEFYAVDHDGSLVRVYDSGDKINWVGNQVNSALWEFTEYTNADGTPNNYYELENTAYSNKFLAPQSNGVIADQPVGINMEGRQEGFDYTNILAWDKTAYAYSGLKVEGNKVVPCPKDEADDFYFAVIVPPVLEADPLTTVDTVDNNEYGISMRMIDFNNSTILDGNSPRDSVQHPFFGSHAYNQNNPDQGLLSTNLTNGYPSTTEKTGNAGHSLSELYSNMTPANHLFIQSVYNESGYFEYDSTQNFAHLNNNGNFTVYNQLGAIGTSTGDTRTHGQFMPYNDINEDTGYAYDTQGNLITNKTDVLRRELPDSDPRKGEPLYSIPQNDADYFFGMELSASFTQTSSGLDNWGHDIIFEFTGDDDFWLYVDGELVLDLGGIHSAMPGSVNFRTGEVIINKTTTSLYDIFLTHYEDRGMSGDAVAQKLSEIFEEKEVNGRSVHVFKDYSNHTMKMFYMERGAGASNLKMRFNLASVQPGTVELSKKLAGTKNTSNKLIQYPYQIWYQMPVYQMDGDTIVHDADGNPIINSYGDPVQLVQGATASAAAAVLYKGTKKLVPFKENLNIDGTDYHNVFLLKAGQTAVIKLPDKNCIYEIIECGVDTEVYEQVKVNVTEITGKLYKNTDSGTEASTDDHRKDFGIDYETTISRPRAEYSNKVAPGVMRTLSFEKLVYDAEGHPLSPEDTAKVSAKFNFRLYLGNEFADENNLSLANMYSYYVKAPGGSYCRWNAADQKFEPLNITNFEGTGGLEEYLSGASSAEKSAVVFTTSLNGSIANIPAGYTVEVRDLIVGTKYKVEEPDREIPKGYTRCDSDGYVRTDLTEGPVVYYTENGTYGYHPAANNTITAEPVSDTIVSKDESPKIEVRNQQGWGLTADKEWTDKDFMIHDPIYLAVYLDENEDGTPDSLIEETVRKLDSDETEIYWFFPDLKINGEPKSFRNFIVREVKLTGTPGVDENGVVTGYTDINPVDEGQKISVGGKTFSGSDRMEDYTVNYVPGESTGHNENIRTDDVKNSRPGIQIYKTDWSGNNFLAGAEFTLKDSEGKDVGSASYTSGSNGLVTTAYLNEGTFTLDEIKTPFGYAALDEPIIITVTTTVPDSYDLTVPAGTTTYYIKLSGPAGFYTTAPATDKDMARITVKNRTVQELKVTKVGVDGSTRTPLSGVHFALYEQVKDSGGNVRPAYNPKNGYEDLVTTEEGVLSDITMSVGAGTYYLREKAVPSGYKKLAEDLCFTIGKNGTVTINNAGYSSWLTRDTSVPGTISYQINIENTPLGITVRKTDETGNALAGSKFILCRKTDSGSFEAFTGNGLGEGGPMDLTGKTEMTFTGMPNGLYKLSETNAPSGYIIQAKDIYFNVSDGALTLTDENGAAKTYPGVSLKDDNTTIAVANTPGAPLPNTGGPGTSPCIFWGMMLLGFAAAGILCKRKIS